MGYNRYNKYANRNKRYEKHVPSRMRVTKEWDSSGTPQPKKGLASKLKEGLQDRIQEYKERNSSENRKKRIETLRLKAQEEALKTNIYTSKSKRSSMRMEKINRIGSIGSGMGGRGGRSVRRTKSSNVYGTGMDWSGMDNMLGAGSKRSKKSIW